jgi:mRNA interferase RelE/StbE
MLARLLPPSEKTRRQVSLKIDALASEPRPRGSKALRGRHEGLRRVRSGDYRIVYHVEDDRLLVLVVKIGPRRDVYR